MNKREIINKPVRKSSRYQKLLQRAAGGGRQYREFYWMDFRGRAEMIVGAGGIRARYPSDVYGSTWIKWSMPRWHVNLSGTAIIELILSLLPSQANSLRRFFYVIENCILLHKILCRMCMPHFVTAYCFCGRNLAGGIRSGFSCKRHIIRKGEGRLWKRNYWQYS